MQWLNNIVDRLISEHDGQEIIVSSGVSPSGTYHLGTLREVMTAEVIAIELRRRGQTAKHIHMVDDLDVFRKVPVNVSSEWEKYLGMPLCDVPSPDGDTTKSYADYFLQDLIVAAKDLNLSMEVVRSHQKYRSGYFVPAIEKALDNVDQIRQILEEVSGRKLDPNWTPIQVIEDGRVKSRQFKAIDKANKIVTYVNVNGDDAEARYDLGEVSLSWRVDWPSRWWLIGVNAEPFGRDHATKGGSYDTGSVIAKQVFDVEPPLPVPYHFINRVGETKKMSKSAGNVITAAQLLKILPPEIVWYFLLHSAPEKQLFFGEGETLIKLFDDFAALQEKPDKEAWEQQLLELCLTNVEQPTVSSVPFSHLVASYQSALRDKNLTLDIIRRSEYQETVDRRTEIILRELDLIDNWLDTWAPADVKFSLAETVEANQFNDLEISYFKALAQKIAEAPADADGAWFHQTIYGFKETSGMPPRDLFTSLYRLIIGKNSGPRAGWFLSILPRDWLIDRLNLVK